jgi:regulator of replication initiation timing
MESPYSAVQYRDGNASLASTIALQQAQHVASSQGFMITSEEQLRREKRRQKKWTVLIAFISLIGFFVALSAVIIEASTIVYIAFVFPIVLGPYVIHQRRKLNKLPSLVFVMNQIRDQINRIMVENSKFNIENTRLENEIQRLNDCETKLGTVIQKSGHDVDTIVSLVKENAETQRQMKVRYTSFISLYIVATSLPILSTLTFVVQIENLTQRLHVSYICIFF